MTIAESALDYAAMVIAHALNIERVEREPIADDSEEAWPGVEIVITLTDGASSEVGYCIGADRPYEFEHVAPLEILITKGDLEERRMRRREALAKAAAAIAADTTLGGRVDHAELTAPDPADEDRFAALSATLSLLYTAPDALG